MRRKDFTVSPEAMDAAKEEARRWMALDPPTHIPADAIRDMLEAAAPVIRNEKVVPGVEAFLLGVVDGYEQGEDFNRGRTWDDNPLFNEIYDQGVNTGIRLRARRRDEVVGEVLAYLKNQSHSHPATVNRSMANYWAFKIADEFGVER